MEMPTVFERKWHSLNKTNQKQAADFIDFLLAKHQMEDKAQPPEPTGIRLGVWKDEPFYIASDFDAPLDDFKEYM